MLNIKQNKKIMNNKKSINAKDLLNYDGKLIQKSISFENDSKMLTQIQPERVYSIRSPDAVDLDPHFLCKIRESNDKVNRYRKQNNKSANSNYFSNKSQLNNEMNVSSESPRVIQNQERFQSNLSPFRPPQLNDEKDIVSTKKSLVKVEKKNIRLRIKEKKVVGGNEQKKPFAKMTEFKTQFNKIKLFEIENKSLQIQGKEGEKLNPYQQSIRKKNLNMIKMKLNSLGEKADEEEKFKYQSLQRAQQQRFPHKKLNQNKQIFRANDDRSRKQIVEEGNKISLWRTLEIRQIGRKHSYHNKSVNIHIKNSSNYDRKKNKSQVTSKDKLVMMVYT